MKEGDGERIRGEGSFGRLLECLAFTATYFLRNSKKEAKNVF